MDDATADAVRKWKERRFRPTDLPFAEAVDSLGTERPLIHVCRSQTRKTDWVLCATGTSTPATFVFAGVFSESDPYETGNLVPPKMAVPAGLEGSRVAQHAGYKAAYSYAIDTFHDKDMWVLQEALDTYMTTVPGFNSREVKRREWQNGSTWHMRYWLRVPMFLTCETRGGRPEPPPGLHEWVVGAHRKTKNYRANPVRPLVCALENGRLQAIGTCTPNVLEYGDVVSVVFSLIYVEDREDWGPVPMVTHVIRVQRANRDAYPLTSTLACLDPVAEHEGLLLGAVVDADEAAAADAAEEAVTAASKRKLAATNPADGQALLPEMGESARDGLPSLASSASDDAGIAANKGKGIDTAARTVPIAADDDGGALVLPVVGGVGSHVSGSGSTVGRAGASLAASVGSGGVGEDAEGSGSEMDVDDEEGVSGGRVERESLGRTDDEDGGSSTSGATLNEDDPGPARLEGFGRGGVKRRRGLRAESDDDNNGNGRGRGSRGRGGGARRAAKVAR